MTPDVIVALVGVLGSVGGAIIAGVTTSKLTVWRIEQLERKVEAHNNLVERMTRTELHNQNQDEDIADNKKDIDALWAQFRQTQPKTT